MVTVQNPRTLSVNQLNKFDEVQAVNDYLNESGIAINASAGVKAPGLIRAIINNGR